MGGARGRALTLTRPGGAAWARRLAPRRLQPRPAATQQRTKDCDAMTGGCAGPLNRHLFELPNQPALQPFVCFENTFECTHQIQVLSLLLCTLLRFSAFCIALFFCAQYLALLDYCPSGALRPPERACESSCCSWIRKSPSCTACSVQGVVNILRTAHVASALPPPRHSIFHNVADRQLLQTLKEEETEMRKQRWRSG